MKKILCCFALLAVALGSLGLFAAGVMGGTLLLEISPLLSVLVWLVSIFIGACGCEGCHRLFDHIESSEEPPTRNCRALGRQALDHLTGPTRERR